MGVHQLLDKGMTHTPANSLVVITELIQGFSGPEVTLRLEIIDLQSTSALNSRHARPVSPIDH